MSENHGIDYGMGTSNRDHATGIRFGVIPINDLHEWAHEHFEDDYGPPTCDQCGNEAIDYDDETHGEYEHGRGCCDYACEDCERSFGSEDAYGDEPISSTLDDGEYQATLGTDGDIFILRSPYYTHAKFCSPCAPGACHLSNPTSEDGPKAYCFGHEFFEGDQAPYTVYSVKTGEVIPGERDKREDSEPQEDDLTTTDHLIFFQYDKVVLVIDEGADMAAELKRWMEDEGFFPNVWLISDHGNAHRIDLSEDAK